MSYHQFKETLCGNKAPEEQVSVLNTTFENRKGHLKQVDDVCVIGIKL